MEYTVQKLAKIAGISSRTLRYYDEINLLKPARINTSGYRIYGKNEVDRLQQIMFYKALGVGLEDINLLMSSPDFNEIQALKSHRNQLLMKRDQLNQLIQNVETTILSKEEETEMSDQSKFEGFKEKMIQENTKHYGDEVIERYGKDVFERSNRKLKNATKEEMDAIKDLGEAIISTLLEAFKTNDPSSELAQKAAYLHKQWISFYWDGYSKEGHLGLGDMYVADERFKKYYDQHQKGLAEFLRDAIKIFVEK
ncbi:MAG: MerR family transcriptional regulator [Clostridia bacterium]|nr:MerR family transcriptional regulator [Clostridia bacterium]